MKSEVDGNILEVSRDDGLSCFRNKSGPELKKIKKKISKKVFKHNGLSITIETNVHIADHLNERSI